MLPAGIVYMPRTYHAEELVTEGTGRVIVDATLHLQFISRQSVDPPQTRIDLRGADPAVTDHLR